MKSYFLILLLCLLNYSCTREKERKESNDNINFNLQILKDSLIKANIDIDKPFIIYTFRQADCLACNVSYSNIENFLNASNITIPRIFLFQDIKRSVITYMLENDLKIIKKPYVIANDSLFNYFNKDNISSLVLVKSLKHSLFSVIPLKEAGNVKDILAPLLSNNTKATLIDSIVLKDNIKFPLQYIYYFDVMSDSTLYFQEEHLRKIFKYNLQTGSYDAVFELPINTIESIYNTNVKGTEKEKQKFKEQAKANLIPDVTYTGFQIYDDSLYITSNVSIQKNVAEDLVFTAIPVLSVCNKNFNISKTYLLSTKNNKLAPSFFHASYVIGDKIWSEGYLTTTVKDSLIHNVCLGRNKDSLRIEKYISVIKPAFIYEQEYDFPVTSLYRYGILYNYFWAYPALINISENKIYRINQNYVSADYEDAYKRKKPNFSLYQVLILSKNLHEFLYLKDDKNICLLVQDTQGNVINQRVLLEDKNKQNISAVIKKNNILYALGTNKDKNIIVYRYSL